MGKAKITSSYEKQDTVIDAIDPVVKYLGVLILGISTIVFPSPILAYVLLLFLVWVAFKARFGRTFLLFVTQFAVPVLLMLVLIQGVFSPNNETVLLELGFTALYLEGVLQALKIVGTLLVFLGSFWLTAKTTDTSRMVAAFERAGITGPVGYLVLATLNVIPQMQNRMNVIKNAQNARGLETEGSIMKRAKAFFPLIGPVIMSSLMNVQERGMTLELRGFGVKKVKRTRLTQALLTKQDKRIRAALLAYAVLAAAASVALRVQGGF